MGSCENCGELTGPRSVPSRRGKKSSSSNKPRQPQRGMGVAQLEKIRLHGELQTTGHGNHASVDGRMLTRFIDVQEDLQAELQFSQRELYSSYNPSSNAMYGYPPSFMMAFSGSDQRHISYSNDLQCYNMERYISKTANNATRETDCCQPPSMTLSLLQQPSDEWEENRWHRRCNSMGSSSRQSDSSDSHELDLDLKLSL